MPATIERPETISEPLEPTVPTGSDNQSPIFPTLARQYQEGWQRVIADTLENWLHDTGQLADDGIDPPTGRTVRLALDVAEKYRDARIIPAPDRVIIDPNGGVIFE